MKLTLVGIIQVAARRKAVRHPLEQLEVIDFVSTLQDIDGLPPRLRAERAVILCAGEEEGVCAMSKVGE